MNRTSIRIRFSIAIGLLICFFSLITMIFSVNNVKDSINDSKYTLSTNKNIYSNAVSEDYASVYENSKDDSIKYEVNIGSNQAVMVDDNTKTNVKVVTVYNEALDLIDTAQNKIVGQQVAFSLFMGILGMLISYPISSILLRPLINLSSDIEGVTSANLKEHLKISNEHDEIGKIKKAFNIMLDRLNNSFERQKMFSANVAHELKTPLSVIKTYTQVIDDDSDVEEYKDIIKVTEKNVDRMISLVNDFVDYVKEENVSVEKVKAKEVIEEVLLELEPIIKNKDITIEKNLEDIELITNGMMFKRLVYNLVNNAIKYNKLAGSIYINLENNSLSIRDTGIGISDEHIENIFEPLYCVDKSRSRELGGSGLGLSIVRNICSSLNYKIEVSSKVGYGTEFLIKL